jgi:hypothetical protein
MNTHNLHSADRSGAASGFFASLLDRDQTEMPSYYLPEASGVAIAGDALLRAVGYHPGSKRPPDWFKKNSGVFRYLKRFKTNSGMLRYRAHDDGVILQVRQCGKLWVIERFRDGDMLDPSGRYPGLNISALVCAHRGRPIWTPTYQAAMHLAQYCHPVVRPPVVAHWVPAHEREHAEFVARYERERTTR